MSFFGQLNYIYEMFCILVGVFTWIWVTEDHLNLMLQWKKKKN